MTKDLTSKFVEERILFDFQGKEKTLLRERVESLLDAAGIIRRNQILEILEDSAYENKLEDYLKRIEEHYDSISSHPPKKRGTFPETQMFFDDLYHELEVA